MFSKLIKSGLASAVIGFGLIAAAPQAALAGQAGFGVTIHGSHGSVHIGNVKHRHYKHRGHRKLCRPGKALYKAERRGVRHARIQRVGKRYVVVKGRKRGNRIKIGFERRSRHCEIAWVDRSRRHGYRY
ncbi:hypothetical protein [Salaquimonas pukyongi]|uniref:hypothetical protein n=1 Tax=Salaquimonas pukyongi TaxID=2712698 RepID=UPI00096B777C|nr:hypothetical protein [Salaquimonas pukyongi]